MSQWTDAVAFDDLADEDVLRFDHGGRTYAIFRVEGRVYATDGLCTHEEAHLADGFVMEHVVECPKHNGRFDVRDGRALGAPVCIHLKTYPARVENGRVLVEI